MKGRTIVMAVSIAMLSACGGVPRDTVEVATRSISDQAEVAKAAHAACLHPPPDAGPELQEQLCQRVPSSLDAITSTSNALHEKAR